MSSLLLRYKSRDKIAQLKSINIRWGSTLTNGVTNLVNCNMQSYAGKTEVNDLPSSNTANTSTITPAKIKTRCFTVGLLKNTFKIGQRTI